MKPVGIIGGSGFYELLEHPRMFVHNNKYGRSSEIFEGTIQGRKVYFLPRHGEEHKIIVPRINYRANIWAFKELGVEQILATNCVGSSNPDMISAAGPEGSPGPCMTMRWRRTMWI